MKKLLPALLLLSCNFLFAQQTTTNESQPEYLRFPTVPPFNLLKVDSTTYLTKDDLKKHHLTMVMFFSPECDHCKHQTRDILAEADKFKDIEIVMATYQPFNEMREFYKNFHIADHPNIKVGRDEKFFLPPFYKIKSLPFLALYDKKGNLITTFEGNQKADTILIAFTKKEN
ncbi:MAG TPA: thioredoxin-like domain-containing protein [Puia sp.]|jgi:thioredoxin-related protein|nr:thioredoxin-like domain-containing protein [Puia sp.]